MCGWWCESRPPSTQGFTAPSCAHAVAIPCACACIWLPHVLLVIHRLLPPSTQISATNTNHSPTSYSLVEHPSGKQNRGDLEDVCADSEHDGGCDWHAQLSRCGFGFDGVVVLTALKVR